MIDFFKIVNYIFIFKTISGPKLSTATPVEIFLNISIKPLPSPEIKI